MPACASTVRRGLRRCRRRQPRAVVSSSARRGYCREQPIVRGIPRNDTFRATSCARPRVYCPLPVNDLLLCRLDQGARTQARIWGGAPNDGPGGSSTAADDCSSPRTPWESELFLRRFIARHRPFSTCVIRASSERHAHASVVAGACAIV